MASEAQQRYILGLARDCELSLFISRSHEAIPFIDMSVRTLNDWIPTLTTREASTVIDYLKDLLG